MKRLLCILVLLLMLGCAQKGVEVDIIIDNSLPESADNADITGNAVEIDLEMFESGFDPEVIRVNEGDLVRINAVSRDMLHGIMISEYNIDERVLPSDITTIEFVADITGEFEIICSLNCGEGHSRAVGTLIVE